MVHLGGRNLLRGWGIAAPVTPGCHDGNLGLENTTPFGVVGDIYAAIAARYCGLLSTTPADTALFSLKLVKLG